jgi:hypothetical protein
MELLKELVGMVKSLTLTVAGASVTALHLPTGPVLHVSTQLTRSLGATYIHPPLWIHTMGPPR